MTSFFKKIFSIAPKGPILGPLFFWIHINNLSDDIESLAKQEFVNARVCAYINGNWIG